MTKNNKNFWIYGKHSALESLKNQPLIKIFVTTQFIKKNPIIKKYKFEIKDKSYLDSLLPDSLHQGIAVLSKYNEPDLAQEISKITSDQSLIIILDSINDPHNIGAIIRSASAFNADAVIINNHGSSSDFSTIAKVSSGTFTNLPLITVTNLSTTIKYLKEKGFWVYGFDVNSSDYLNSVQFHSKTAIVMGSEGKGIKTLVRKNCDFLLKIPISSSTESLNVSNATSIAMYEFFKQQST